LSFFSLNKLSEITKAQKDPLLKLSNMNVVYKIHCEECDISYAEQTGRQLKTRILKRKNHIHRNTSTHSVTEHCNVIMILIGKM